MKEILSTQAAPAAIGPYSQGVSVGGIVITSGQLPVDPATGAFAEGGVAGQTRQSLLNVQAVLAAAGLTLENVLKTTGFLKDRTDYTNIYCQQRCGDFFSHCRRLGGEANQVPHPL